MKFWKICTKFYINVKGQVYSLQYCRRNFCVTSLVSPVVTQSGKPAKNKMTPQYLVWAPLARIPARILLCIESIRTLIRLNGMLFHSCVNAAINWARSFGGVLTFPNTSVQFIPQMLNGRHVGAIWGPFQRLNIVCHKKITTDSGNMQSSIVLLEN